MTTGDALLTGSLFCMALLALSFTFNRILAPGGLDLSRLALFASCVFLVAVLIEATLNPAYEFVTGHKLWVYRVLPRHDGNVSALAPLVWTCYGIHLYLLMHTLARRLPPHLNTRLFKAIIIGFEAPLFAEVFGNLFFLALGGEYYAYYLPGEILHLTSIQVIPMYMLAVYAGLCIYDWLQHHSSGPAMSALVYSGGLVFVAAG